MAAGPPGIYTDNFYPCDGGSACELALTVRYFDPQDRYLILVLANGVRVVTAVVFHRSKSLRLVRGAGRGGEDDWRGYREDKKWKHLGNRQSATCCYSTSPATLTAAFSLCHVSFHISVIRLTSAWPFPR
jgi:hypothetical protein